MGWDGLFFRGIISSLPSSQSRLTAGVRSFISLARSLARACLRVRVRLRLRRRSFVVKLNLCYQGRGRREKEGPLCVRAEIMTNRSCRVKISHCRVWQRYARIRRRQYRSGDLLAGWTADSRPA